MHHFDADLRRRDRLGRARANEYYNKQFFSITVPDSIYATFDPNGLTRLDFFCHLMCVRCEFKAVSAGILRLLFHPREGRSGHMCDKHPSIEDALQVFKAAKYGLFTPQAESTPEPTQCRDVDVFTDIKERIARLQFSVRENNRFFTQAIGKVCDVTDLEPHEVQVISDALTVLERAK
jgi:hypothetical protein